MAISSRFLAFGLSNVNPFCPSVEKKGNQQGYCCDAVSLFVARVLDGVTQLQFRAMAGYIP